MILVSVLNVRKYPDEGRRRTPLIPGIANEDSATVKRVMYGVCRVHVRKPNSSE